MSKNRCCHASSVVLIVCSEVLFVLGKMSMEECGSLLCPRDPEVIAIFMWKAAKTKQKTHLSP